MEARFGHLPSLDGLRAISISLVLLAQYVSEHMFPGGLGVLVFFVISGFLITRLTIAERKERASFDVLDFTLRRAFRLLPALFVFCGVASLLVWRYQPKNFDWRELAATIFYVENYFTTWRQVDGIPTTMPFTPFWSLSVEEQFYAVFAAVVYFWASTPKRLVWVAGVATVFPLILRFVYAIVWPQLVNHESLFIYAHTETRIDSIAAGVMIAAACEFERGRRIITWLITPGPVAFAFFAAAGCFFLVHSEFFRDTLRYTILDACAAVLLCAVVFSDRYWLLNWLLNSRAFRWTGIGSYSIYIWHLGADDFVSAVVPGLPRIVQGAMSLLLVLALAAVSYLCVEKPTKKLKAPTRRLLVLLWTRIRSGPSTSKSAS